MIALILAALVACGGPGRDQTLTDACITYYEIACDCGLDDCIENADDDDICGSALDSYQNSSAADEILAAQNCQNAVLDDTCDPVRASRECRDEILASYEAQQ